MLSAIERATRQKIDMMELPSTEIINDKRIDKFKQRITDTLSKSNDAIFTQLIEQYQQEHNVPAVEIAAALAQLLQGDNEFLLTNKPKRKQKSREEWDQDGGGRGQDRDRGRGREDRPRRERSERSDRPPRKERQRDTELDEGMNRYRIEVGHNHQVKPGNIVGAIANEADIESRYIGRISIHDDHSTVDLPEGMPKELLYTLKKVWVSGQQLKISLDGQSNKSQDSGSNDSTERPPEKKKSGKRHPVSPSDGGRGNDGRKGKLSLKKRVRRR